MSLILDGTNGLSDVDGTAAAPAIRGTDSNTGIFFGTDIIGFSEGGAEAMRINSSGQLLIGATSSDITGKLVAVVGSTANGFAVQNDGSTGTFFGVTTGAANGNVTLRADARSGNYPPMLFDIGASERARFNTTGAFVFAGGTTTADGIGITFPATQSASTNANTLDDYEEGTFTPTAIGGSSAGTTTYTSQSGQYTKIGRVVTARFAVGYSSLTGTGELVISLPFAANGEYMGSVMTNGLNWSGSGTSLTVYTVTSVATCRIFISGDDASWSVQQCVNEGADFILTVTYFVA
jgi:hypothetical protein